MILESAAPCRVSAAVAIDWRACLPGLGRNFK